MKRWLTLFLIPAAVLVGCASEQRARHLALTRELVREVAPAETVYQHKPTVVRWEEKDASAVCRADCSGLMNEVYKRAWSLDDSGLASWLGSERPLARHYARAIREERGFTPVNPFHALPGDIITIRYEAGAGNSGHVAMIDAEPETEAGLLPTGLVANMLDPAPLMWVWRVRVIDASSTGHGPGDSRYQGSKRVRNGLGTGVIRVATDASGSIVAHAFSTAPTSRWHLASERPVAIGRPTGPPFPEHPASPAGREEARATAVVR